MTEENHNPYYLKGTKLIEPFIDLEGKSITVDSKAKDSIIEGIRYLDAVTKINPNNFAAYWIKGKGYQSLKQHDRGSYTLLFSNYNQRNLEVFTSLNCLFPSLHEQRDKGSITTRK